MGLVGWNEKNQILEKINYFFNSIIEAPAKSKKTGGAFFQLLFFQLSIISESWKAIPMTLFQWYFRRNGEKWGWISNYFFSITTNYNYFWILGLGDKEPTFFFIPTTINHCHAAVNERNRQESLFFFRTNSIIGGPSQSQKKRL